MEKLEIEMIFSPSKLCRFSESNPVLRLNFPNLAQNGVLLDISDFFIKLFKIW